MATVYIVDSNDTNYYFEKHSSSGIELNPNSEKFNSKLFKSKACLKLNIQDFIKKFNTASLDISDQRYYIYLEI